MRTIRITNDDGHSVGTKIVDAATGREIVGVRRVTIVIDPANPIIATLEIGGVEIDVIAQTTDTDEQPDDDIEAS